MFGGVTLHLRFVSVGTGSERSGASSLAATGILWPGLHADHRAVLIPDSPSSNSVHARRVPKELGPKK
jgi:hypothetical protein